MNLKKIKVINMGLATLALAFTVQVHAEATTDGEYLDVVRTANEAEISAAELAKTSATSPKVREFAQHMIKEHKANLKTADKVISKSSVSYATNNSSEMIESDANTKLGELRKAPANSNAFDKLYVDQQIEMHNALLTEINTKLIPNAKNADVKKYLEDTKKHVASHLAAATKLKSEL